MCTCHLSFSNELGLSDRKNKTMFVVDTYLGTSKLTSFCLSCENVRIEVMHKGRRVNHEIPCAKPSREEAAGVLKKAAAW